jgi:hypothetical protein
VEYMGEKDGGACSVCDGGVDLCCPQFTIPLDSSDAFTGPIPSLTIPTGTDPSNCSGKGVQIPPLVDTSSVELGAWGGV